MPSPSSASSRSDGSAGAPETYQAWCDRLLDRGLAFVLPSSRVDDETVMRFCFVNPRTTIDDVDLILGTMD